MQNDSNPRQPTSLILKRNSLIILLKILPKKFVVFQLQSIRSSKLFAFILKVKRTYTPSNILLKFTGDLNTITCICFSHCNGFLAFSSDNHNVMILYISALNSKNFGKCIVRIYDHILSVNSICFSLSDRMFATSGFDKLVVINLLQKNTSTFFSIEQKLKIQTDFEVHSIAFSSNEELLAVGGRANVSGGMIQVYKIITDKELLASLLQSVESHTSTVNSLSFFPPDSEFLASCGNDRQTMVYQVISGNLNKVLTLSNHTLSALKLAIDQSGSYLATCSCDETIYIYSVNRMSQLYGQVLGKIHAEDSIMDISFNQCGNLCSSQSLGLVFGTSRLGKKVMKFIKVTLKSNKDKEDSSYLNIQEVNEFILGHYGWVYSVATSVCGNYLAAGADLNTLVVYY